MVWKLLERLVFIMSKSKVDKKINKKVREFNKELKKDVFNSRFELRQYQKAKLDDMHYYLYQLVDNLEPERNRVIREWLRGESPFFMSRLWEEMNDFIIKSDFWELWRKKDEDK